VDSKGALEQKLDPQRGRRHLAKGILYFRVISLAWMLTLNLVSRGFSRPWLAYLSMAAAAAWTAWLWVHPRDQTKEWVLWFDLALTSYLILASALVVPRLGVISPTRLFFATGYPVSTPLMWAMSKKVRGGLGSGFVMSIALFLTRPLNHIPIHHITDVIGVANGSAYFLIGGYTIGIIANSLEKSADSVRRAVAVAMEEQDRARWADTVNDLHESVQQGLGILTRELAQLLSDQKAMYVDHADADKAAPVPLLAELERLAALASEQDQYLREWSQRDRMIHPGMVNLGDRLKQTRAEVPGIETDVISVGKILVPDRIAAQLCGAVKQALQNVDEHAETDRAWVFAEIDDLWLLTSVRDKGKGYNPSDRPPADHQGRTGMRQRVEENLGGRVKEISAPGAGTTVEFRIPMTWDGQ